MTNWQMIEQITFRCPDCGHIQNEMTPACPVCRKTRTAPMQPEQSEYQISFGMNGGQRKERYRMLLTVEQARMLSGLPDHEAFNLFWTMWDQVVDAYVDAGTDYEGICCGVTELMDEENMSSDLK
jgi:hypothetical protein